MTVVVLEQNDHRVFGNDFDSTAASFSPNNAMRNVSSLFLKFRIASFGLRHVTSVRGNEAAIRSWSYGELELADGKLLCIRPRWWPRMGSQWESFQDSYIRTLPVGLLRTYYAFPWKAPGFMSVLYAQAGPNTQYKTLHRAVTATDEIARLKSAQAIVCQLVSNRASERLMKRWGYVRHAQSLGDNHYIKRLN